MLSQVPPTRPAAGIPRRSRRSRLLAPLLLLVALVLALLVAPGQSANASATGCSYGVGGSQDSSTCWLDFSGFVDAQARTPAGQAMSIALPGGYTATFRVQVADATARVGTWTATRTPTWSGAYLGQNGHFVGIAGKPALYASGGTAERATVQDVVVTDGSGNRVHGFALLAADAESSNTGETLQFDSDVPLTRVDAQSVCGGGLTGVGTTSVSCVGLDSTAGRALFLQAVDPTSVTIQTGEPGSTNGRQAVAFAFVHATVAVNAVVAGRLQSSDDFRVAVDGAASTLGTATTGGTTGAGTGDVVVVPSTGGDPYSLSVAATSGSIANYTASWSCANSAATSTTALPSGTGSTRTIGLAAGDDVACTVTLTPRSRAVTVVASAQAADVNGDGITDAGDRVDLTYVVTNTGATALQQIAVADPAAGAVTCVATALAAGASTTCATSHVITAADEIAGGVPTSAVATGVVSSSNVTATSPSSTTDVPVTPADPRLTVALSGSPARFGAVGDVLRYSAVVHNTGNIPMRSLTVTTHAFTGSGPAPVFTCTPVQLSVGGTATCSAPYTATQHDVDAGLVSLDVTAAATGAGNATRSTASSSTVAVQADAAAAVALSAAADPGTVRRAGDRITWSFTARNTGAVTLAGLTVVPTTATSTVAPPAMVCDETAIAPGGTTRCTATAPVSQADVDADAIAVGALLRATRPDGTAVASSVATATVSPSPAQSIAVLVDRTGSAPTRVGDPLLLRYTATNTGDRTLRAARIVAERGAGALSCPDPDAVLAPGASVACSARIPVTQQDIDTGEVVEHATGTATGVGEVRDTASLRTALTATRSVAITIAEQDRVHREGDAVRIAVVLRNTGSATFRTADATATYAGRAVRLTCDDAMVPPGASTDCHADVTVSAADVAAGAVPFAVAAHGVVGTPAARTEVRTAAAADVLAFTGSSAALPIAGGLLVALLGVVLLIAGRRRRLLRR